VAGLDRSLACVRSVALIHSHGLICFEPGDCMKAQDHLYDLNGAETDEATNGC
jgi:hypothetical protein